MMPQTTITSLPVELRLKIYGYILSSSPIHSLRPQRKLGWNRPHADLSNPVMLFEADCHRSLHNLFHHKFTKSDHVLILTQLCRQIKSLILDHADVAALQTLCCKEGNLRTRVFASVVARSLREIDFGDRVDEVICQPRDLEKLLAGLKGLQKVNLSGRHAARHSGTCAEHVEFARDRARRETQQGNVKDGKHGKGETPAEEFRRMNLRSPMTDGSRMMISPAGFSGFSGRGSASSARTVISQGSLTWVVVDLSMLMWKHYLYTGPPYKDHWRCEKMKTLFEVAEKLDIEVILTLRHVEFDPEWDGWGGRPGGDIYKASMSTKDWLMQLCRKGCTQEYRIRQRKVYDELVSQDGCGLFKCNHARRTSPVCGDCITKIKVGDGGGVV